jgi:hypothetical protein
MLLSSLFPTDVRSRTLYQIARSPDLGVACNNCQRLILEEERDLNSDIPLEGVSSGLTPRTGLFSGGFRLGGGGTPLSDDAGVEVDLSSEAAPLSGSSSSISGIQHPDGTRHELRSKEDSPSP